MPTTIPLPPRWLPLVALLVLCPAQTLLAQAYRFAIQRMDLEATALPDASAKIKYTIVFRNQPGAKAIDIVDIGLPHAGYDLDAMSASIDGQPLPIIRPSDYIDVGVEVPLGIHAIPPGQEGTFRFEAIMPDMVYQDTTDAQRAALQIKPTWFDPSLQVGTTHLRIAVHLPPGVQPDEVTYHEEALRYQDLALFGQGDQAHVVAAWNYPNHRLSEQNSKVGISFPKRVMDRVVRMTAIGLFVKWFSESQRAQIGSGGLLVCLLGFGYFRFTRGTGCVVGLLLLGLLIWMMAVSPLAHLLAWPVIVGLVIANEWYLRRRPHTRYLPAIATVEGGGVKRGLTAPQAAILLELPLSRVLTLVIFGLLKKDVVEATSHDPLTVRVHQAFHGSEKSRRKAASERGIVIHDYEQPFLDRLQHHHASVGECDLNEALGKLIRSVVARMKGFDVDLTRDYYRWIVERAWKEAQSVGEVSKRTATVDEKLEWLLIDRDAPDRFNHWRHGGFHYYPTWTRPSGGTIATGGTGAATPIPTASHSQTSLGEVASSFTGWMENTAGQLAGSIEPAKMGVDVPKGVVDLTSVDTATKNFFEAMSESSGGGGGCACACAGCACACACAGGGR